MHWSAIIWNKPVLHDTSDPDRKYLLQAAKDQTLLFLHFKPFLIDFSTGHMYKDGISLPVQYVDYPCYYRLIYVLTRGFSLNANTGQQSQPETLMYKIGWQITFEGKNYQQVLWIQPNGSFEIKGDRK